MYFEEEVGAVGRKGYKIKEKLSNALELPKDIVMDVAKITLIGNNQVSIENHKGIIEYSDDVIRVNTGCGILSMEGSHLCIKTILPEEITITGEISGLNYV